LNFSGNGFWQYSFCQSNSETFSDFILLVVRQKWQKKGLPASTLCKGSVLGALAYTGLTGKSGRLNTKLEVVHVVLGLAKV